MSEIKIAKDMNVVKIMAAQARKESVDSNLVKESNDLIRELASDLSPNNKYAIAQLVGFTVNELLKPATNWMDMIADVKRVAFGDKAQFKTRLEGIRAYIQAKGATTARSKVANKAIVLDTMAVSARPVINIVELKSGQVDMADLIVEAAYEMEVAEMAYVQQVLNAAVTQWAAPYYGTGSGIVKATFDPMVRHWQRLSGGGAPAIIGDIGVISKLAEQTGFTATLNPTNNATSVELQFNDGIIGEYNNFGYIGKYIGANVMQMVNPTHSGTDNYVFDLDKVFILPAGAVNELRPLKVLFEGDVESQEQTNIDDKSYEVRLDQYMGAGLVYGIRPYMSVYDDSSI